MENKKQSPFLGRTITLRLEPALVHMIDQMQPEDDSFHGMTRGSYIRHMILSYIHEQHKEEKK